MLEKVVLAALGNRRVLRSVVEEEIERLSEGGYLQGADLERLAQESIAALEGRLAQVRGSVAPLMQEVGRSIREALDIPSRSEILALTEELREARGAGTTSPPPGDRSAPGGE